MQIYYTANILYFLQLNNFWNLSNTALEFTSKRILCLSHEGCCLPVDIWLTSRYLWHLTNNCEPNLRRISFSIYSRDKVSLLETITSREISIQQIIVCPWNLVALQYFLHFSLENFFLFSISTLSKFFFILLFTNFLFQG